MTTQPMSGASRMIRLNVVIRSALELSQLVDVDGQPPPVDRDDEAEPDGDLAGGHDHHDQREDLPLLVALRAREGDEREVARVEHQLEAEQDDQRVAAGEDAPESDAEHQRRDDEVPLDAHRCGGPPASSSVPRSASPTVPLYCGSRMRSATEISRASSSPVRRRARMTAPTAAISSSSEAASKARRKSVRNSLPIWAAVPKPAK